MPKLNFGELKNLFLNPPRGFGPVPFWAINSTMDVDTIRRSLTDLKNKKIDEVIIHPRSGLVVEYLSDEFWRGMDVIVSELERLDMRGWIYDEYNWPSGIAGGRLLRERPDFRQSGLNWFLWKRNKSVELKGTLVAAFDVRRNFAPILDQEGLRTFVPPDGARECLVFYREWMTDRTFASSCAPWAKSELGALDYLNPEAVDYFMELTHRQYEKRYSSQFGKTLVGLFTDEPQNYRGFPWCADMPDEFYKRAGYDLIPAIYRLTCDGDDSRKTRSDFYRVAGELFSERYYNVVGEWCRKNGLAFTGHLGMEEFLDLAAANHGSVSKPLCAMDVPGIDMLGVGHGFGKGVVHSPHPNFAPKLASSVAHLCGRKRALVELWGGGGWNASPRKLKKSLDWMFALGLNFINPHLAWVDASGLRKRDFPQSFGVEQPWWESFASFSEYISRVSAVMSQGVHRARLLLLYPSIAISSLFKGRGVASDGLSKTITAFSSLMNDLILSNNDFDLLFEDLIDSYKIGDGKIIAGSEFFDVLMIPDIDSIGDAARNFIGDAVKQKVKVVACGDKTDSLGNINFTNAPVEWLNENAPPALKIKSDAIVLSLHRQVGDTHLFFIADVEDRENSGDGKSEIAFRNMAGRRFEIWNPSNPVDCPKYQIVAHEKDLIVSIQLPEGASILVAVGSEKHNCEATAVHSSPPRIKTISPERWERRFLSPNIDPLEPCAIETKKRKIRSLDRLRLDRNFSIRARLTAFALRIAMKAAMKIKPPEKNYKYERYFNFQKAMKASDLVERYVGIPARKYGPYQAMDLIDEWAEYFETPPGKGKMFVSAGEKYTLSIDVDIDFIPDDIEIVYENVGEEIFISVNGKNITEFNHRFVWDKSNRVAAIKEFLKIGKNKIIFSSRLPDYPCMYPTIHAPELMALSGSFAVHDNRICKPAAANYNLETWAAAGFPFYFGAALYSSEIEIAEENISTARLDLGECFETAEIFVNGKKIVDLLWPPYAVDVGESLIKGKNKLEIIVRNTAAGFFDKPRNSGLIGPVRLGLAYQ